MMPRAEGVSTVFLVAEGAAGPLTDQLLEETGGTKRSCWSAAGTEPKAVAGRDQGIKKEHLAGC